jgi:hypothetical protein
VEKAVPQKIVKLQAKRKLQWHVVSRIGGSNTVAPVSFVSGMKSFQERQAAWSKLRRRQFFPGPNADFTRLVAASRARYRPASFRWCNNEKNVGNTQLYYSRVAIQLLQQPHFGRRAAAGRFLVGSLNSSPQDGCKADRVLAIFLPAPAVPAETTNLPMPFIL